MSATFGYRDVEPAEKPALVRGVFERVASRYDLMNDLMSLGAHRLWKDAAAARLNPQPGELIVDCAGGTGDLARRYASLARRAQGRRGGEAARIVVTDISAALAEARRVLKPGGRFLCLEFSKLTPAALRPLYDAYSFSVIPRVGERVAGDGEAYRYLVESIRRFPDQKALAKLLGAAGFSRVSVTNFAGGVAALHQGWAI